MNPNALPAGAILNSGKQTYRIVRVLGSGGFGITYLAVSRQKVGNITVPIQFAVKEHFMSDFCERDSDTLQIKTGPGRQTVENSMKDFLGEARRLQQVGDGHPSIVKVNEVFEANNTAYYVMEYLDGESLRSYVRSRGKLTEAETLDLLRPVMEAVDYLHEQRMTHLDIKPDNIMLAREEDASGNAVMRPVLIDFGLSKHYDASGHATSTVNTLGCSDGYAPLEQYAGITTFSPSADIYALAATVLFCLTGKDPRRSPDMLHIDIPSWLAYLTPPLTPALKSLLAASLSPLPTDRPASMLDVPVPVPTEEETPEPFDAGNATVPITPEEPPVNKEKHTARQGSTSVCREMPVKSADEMHRKPSGGNATVQFDAAESVPGEGTAVQARGVSNGKMNIARWAIVAATVALCVCFDLYLSKVIASLFGAVVYRVIVGLLVLLVIALVLLCLKLRKNRRSAGLKTASIAVGAGLAATVFPMSFMTYPNYVSWHEVGYTQDGGKVTLYTKFGTPLESYDYVFPVLPKDSVAAVISAGQWIQRDSTLVSMIKDTRYIGVSMNAQDAQVTYRDLDGNYIMTFLWEADSINGTGAITLSDFLDGKFDYDSGKWFGQNYIQELPATPYHLLRVIVTGRGPIIPQGHPVAAHLDLVAERDGKYAFFTQDEWRAVPDAEKEEYVKDGIVIDQPDIIEPFVLALEDNGQKVTWNDAMASGINMPTTFQGSAIAKDRIGVKEALMFFGGSMDCEQFWTKDASQDPSLARFVSMNQGYVCRNLKFNTLRVRAVAPVPVAGALSGPQ